MGGTLNTTPELLKEGAALLKEELLLGTEALRAAQALRQALQDTAAGRGTGAALSALEAVLGMLREFHRRLDGFLARAGAERLTAFFAAQPPSSLRTGALALLPRTASQQHALRRELQAGQGVRRFPCQYHEPDRRERHVHEARRRGARAPARAQDVRRERLSGAAAYVFPHFSMNTNTRKR